MGAVARATPTAIQAIEQEVKALTITSPATYEAATGLMIRIRQTRKAAEDALKTALAPLKKQIKDQQDAAQVGLTLLQTCEAQLQRGILAYQEAGRKAAEEQRKKELAKYEAKVAKAEAKAEATGKPVALVPLPPVIQAPATAITTDRGTLNVLKVKKWRIAGVTDAEIKQGIRRSDPRVTDLPDMFFELVAGDITKLVKSVGQAGQPLPGLPGVEVYEENSLTVRG